MAIQGFGDRETDQFFKDGVIPKGAGWAGVARAAGRKLDLLDYAGALEDLRAPPGNRLEKLKGELRGHYSIRVNDRWRIVFRWTGLGPVGVTICDYH